MKIRFGKWMVMGAALAATVVSGAGCLTRPVGQQPPTTKVNFTSTISQQQVDKIDLLLMIDNSASMGDKQEILADAVPQLVKGLLTPRCVNQVDQKPLEPEVRAKPTGPEATEENRYGCPANSEPEFKPVSDMHIGIISSSLGSFGGDVCPETGRANDRAHLLNIVKGGGEVAKAKPSNFLAWFPSIKENDDEKRHPKPQTPSAEIGAEASGATKGTGLIGDFQELVKGVDQTGCGLEAQLESFYRFLIQPDPWTKVTLNQHNQADLGADNDVDTELLQQRADFLRPDSLVAIVMLTDEDDSSADPLSVGGQGWAFMANKFPGSPIPRGDGQTTTAPRATSTCATNPNETGYQQDGKTPNGKTPCTSCGFAATCNAGDPVCQKIKADPECAKNQGYYGPNEDQLNVRFHRMQERYGIDPQYPIQRYVDGLTKKRIPDRKAEHPTTVAADGRKDIKAYQSTGKCTNPLFAKSLPRAAGDELCQLASSTRTADLVFFAVVGGVPNELLPKLGSDDAVDWKKILGADPTNFNYDGIDPHMIQSVSPRPGLPGPSGTRGDNGTDKIHGREYDTQADDLQYACTFNLPTVRKCTKTDPSCDCAKANVIPPLCGNTEGDQIKAKAYPTIREFKVVKALGDQGIIASLCPITLDGSKTANEYGYNPAVAQIIERLKNALTTQCLPQQLTREKSGEDKDKVPCLVLATLGDASESCDKYGLKPPAADILAKFRETQKQQQGEIKDAQGATDLTKLPVCEVPQLVVAQGQSCKTDPSIGWCYVENVRDASGQPVPGQTPAGRCPQALIFSKASGAMAGAQFSLQCIQQFSSGQAAGDPASGDGG